MDTLQVAAISFALSQVVLSTLLLAGDRRWVTQQRLYVLLMLAIACYLLEPVFDDAVSKFVLGSLMTAVPGMFYLFSASLFDDHFELRAWQVGLVGATVLLPLVGHLLHLAGTEQLDFLFFTLPQGLEFLLLGLTLYVVARYWNIDLVESRRRLRLWFSGLNGLYIFVLLLFREILFAGADWLNTLQFVPVGGILLATNAILLTYKGEIWSTPAPLPKLSLQHTFGEPGGTARAMDNNPADTELEVPPELLQALNTLMEEEKIYRQMGLTIGKVANQLEIPEYRLRQVINTGLGYRNFNDFLNSFRIREASQRLSDPAERELQVLAIALDTGFRSLSSFNKAFRATYATTPTAYRKQHLGEA